MLCACEFILPQMKSDKEILYIYLMQNNVAALQHGKDVAGNGFQINKNIYREQSRMSQRTEGGSRADKLEETIFTSKRRSPMNKKHG